LSGGRLHRIDDEFAKAELNERGLEFCGSINVLRNPGDGRTLNVFDPAIRGQTNRFANLYRKP